jgi:hypothetical protein
MTVSKTIWAVGIPVGALLVVCLLSCAYSAAATWRADQQKALAGLVHAASRAGFAARQDKNRYMALINTTTARAQLAAARRLLSDEDLSRMVGVDVRAMASQLEEHQRVVLSRISTKK